MKFSVDSLLKNAYFCLSKGDINKSLQLVYDFVEKIVTEPICTGLVFSSFDLDKLCLDIGKKNFYAIDSICNNSCHSNGNAVCVYIVSRLQRSGGHSRLIQEFILAQPEKEHVVLSTEIIGSSDKDFFSEIFEKNEKVKFFYAPSGRFDNRLRWLQSLLLELCPEHIYLFNHHQDSVAVSAVIPEITIKGSFIHHGDHHLCLGVHLNHLNHIDLHPMGYHYCRNKLEINNFYLPLTVQDKNDTKKKKIFAKNEFLVTATAARSNKIEIPYYISYLDVIPDLLAVTKGVHIHIGKLTPWALRRIYKNMRRIGIEKDRFIYIEWVPSVWETLYEYRVDIYMASFPYGAGLTLIEAMGAGVPVILHKHMYSRVLSGLELAYPEAFRWSTTEELFNHLSNIDLDQLEAEKKLAREQYEKSHHYNILRDFLKENSKIPVPELDKDYQPKYDEWAAWIYSQINIYKLTYNTLYRLFRKLRRMVS